jgi:hypothetical protein
MRSIYRFWVLVFVFILIALGNHNANAGELKIDFNDGHWRPLRLFYGPTDNPATQDQRFTVEVMNGQAVYLAPAAQPGPRLTGFLEPPEDMFPMKGDLTISWTFPKVAELLALGGGSGQPAATAGYYIRGKYDFQSRKGDWAGGLFGDYWLGFSIAGGKPISMIRQGRTNLTSEAFTAIESVSYRIEKSGMDLRLFANYDNKGWHQVGEPVKIRLEEGGKDDVAMTHLRILDLSGASVRVTADDFLWSGPAIGGENK